MRTLRTIVALSVAAVALGAAAYLPATAMADTGTGGSAATTATVPPSAPTTATVKPTRRTIVLFKLRAKLRLRAFDRDAAVLKRRIDRLGAIATRVRAKGGDVSAVRNSLQQARAELALAKAQARTAAADLRLVPWAADRKAAWAAANAEFATARDTLKTARSDRKTAAAALRILVKQYHVKNVLAKNLV